MKKLIFVRHGKAEDESPEISDFERSLTLRGKLVCRLMAHKLKTKEQSPGILVTSSAFRALETALIFAGEFGINEEDIILKRNIYHGLSIANLQDIISGLSEETETITLFGHNPSFSDITNSLCKEGCDFMPKSGVICISFNIRTWSEIKRNSGKLEYFLKPEKIHE
jgi:Phosphohistidine phosphatase SixA